MRPRSVQYGFRRRLRDDKYHIYFGLIAALIYFLVEHARNYETYLHARPEDGGPGLWMMIYAVPLIIGPGLLMFLLKALFKPWQRHPEPRKVARSSEPLLFAFVERICQSLGAPVPTEIRVDCDVNASASFLKGWRGLFTNNLVLTIGLPLANAMSVREFAGVVAHEMGHFSQPAAMRLTYIIETLNEWLEHIASDDSMQGSLGGAQRVARVGGVALYFYLATILFIWITRLITWLLMLLGNAVSCYMLRQMEYDADRHAAALVGTDAFESALRKLPVLSAAEYMAFDDLQVSFDEGRLADDLPLLIANCMGQIPVSAQKEIQKDLTEETGTFDTHPSGRDRINALRRIKFTPVLLIELPATALFRNFEQLSRTATVDLYTLELGREFLPVMLKRTEKVAEQAQTDYSGEESRGRFLQK